MTIFSKGILLFILADLINLKQCLHPFQFPSSAVYVVYEYCPGYLYLLTSAVSIFNRILDYSRKELLDVGYMNLFFKNSWLTLWCSAIFEQFFEMYIFKIDELKNFKVKNFNDNKSSSHLLPPKCPKHSQNHKQGIP